MKRVGVIVDNELNTDERVRREIRLLQNQGFVISVLCFAFEGKKYEDIEGVDVHRIPIAKNKKNNLYFFYHLSNGYKNLWINNIASFIKKVKPNVLHAHDLYMSEAVMKGIQKSKSKIPFVLDLHENYPDAIQSYNWTKGWLRSKIVQAHKWKKLEAQYLSYPDRLILLSDDFKNQLTAKYSFLNPEHIGIIPNAIDLETFNNSSPKLTESLSHLETSSDIVFFYFGAIAQRRGIFDVLKAFPKLINVNPNCVLLLIGPIDNADQHEFSLLSSDLIARKKLIYEPWINLENLPAYLNIVDVGLAPFEKNPQHESGIANKIYQYMFGKLPIIASNCKPQQKLLEQEKAGLIFSNEEELVSTMLQLAEDSNLRIQLGENGYKALIDRYTIDAYSEEMRRIFSIA